MTAAAAIHVERLPAMFSDMQQLMRENDPQGLLASVAFYGLQRSIREDGSTSSASTKLEQHHVELLQAVLLSLRAQDWGTSPSTPRAVNRVFEELPSLSLAFLAQRIVAGVDPGDAQARTVSALQERVRFHTHAVRNWGYFGDVVAIARDLYSPLDHVFLAHHGFGASDVIEVARTMVAELERRGTAWAAAMRPVASAADVDGMVRRYCSEFPHASASADELAARLPAGVGREQVLGMLMGHADLLHAENMSFDAPTLALAAGLDPVRTERAMRAIALRPGALADRRMEFLFLDNPVWAAPLIDLGSSFLAPMPQAIMSHVHAIVRRLAGEAGALDRLDAARAAYLERKLGDALRAALPGADVTTGAKWSIAGQRFETDALARIDKVLLVSEAKATHLTPQGLRGAPDRVRRHVRDMILEPSIQSARLEGVVRDAANGSAEAGAAMAEAGIRSPGEIERVIRLSVSLDDLSVLASAEQELREAGWIPAGHELAPMMNVADLLAVADILDEPAAFLHYLAERGPFQRTFELIGDELDFLGLYLETGFNLAGVPADMRLIPSGMSEAIDRFYDARDAGLPIAKPRVRIGPYFQSILRTLADRRPPGWTLIGMNLLGAADQREQARLVRLLERARKAVRRRTKGMEEGAVVSVTPPVERKASVAFYVHRIDDREDLRRAIGTVASKNLAGAETVVFARHVDRWEEPYQVAAIAKASY